MVITRDLINDYFCALTSVPNGNVLSEEGFIALADWSEQQDWWLDFAGFHCLNAEWRLSNMGDPYKFALTLFRFIAQRTPVECPERP